MDSTNQFGDRWVFAEGSWHNDRPIHIRLRAEIDNFIGSPQFPVGYRIVWKIGNPNEQGFPSPEVDEIMKPFTAQLLNGLEANGTAILAAIVTHNGERHFIFYTSNSDVAHEQFLDTFSSQRIPDLAFSTAPDPEWREYLGLKAQIPSPE